MRIGLAWLFACLIAAARAAGPSESDHVVVLANSREDESLRLARYYAAERSIPDRNIIALPMPVEETISWASYVSEIHRPLLERLVADGWIGADLVDETDLAGRPLITLKGHGIAFLVACRGVPLRIEHDPALLEAEGADLPPNYLTNHAAVDSELSLLTRSNPPTTGVITNPLYRQKEPSARRMVSIVRVARLDGPTWADCYRLVDQATLGEARGLMGRVYLDGTGNHQEGNQWLEAIAERTRDLGFDVEEEASPALMGLTDRMDGTALYFGWHSSKVTGPFLNGSPFFQPGAVAVHIYSFSAGSMRRGWTAAMVRAGAAATLGNVYEPYLQLTHDLALFFERLEAGSSVGEAAWYALPGQSWQGILVGDPLYRPFTKEFQTQWEGSADSRSPYLAMRKANRLQASGLTLEAREVLEDQWERIGPDLALAFRMAEWEGDGEGGGMDRLGRIAKVCDLRPDQWGLALVVADRMAQVSEWAGAMELLERLLEETSGSVVWRGAIVDRLIEWATLAGDQDRLQKYDDSRVSPAGE